MRRAQGRTSAAASMMEAAAMVSILPLALAFSCPGETLPGSHPGHLWHQAEACIGRDRRPPSRLLLLPTGRTNGGAPPPSMHAMSIVGRGAVSLPPSSWRRVAGGSGHVAPVAMSTTTGDTVGAGSGEEYRKAGPGTPKPTYDDSSLFDRTAIGVFRQGVPPPSLLDPPPLFLPSASASVSASCLSSRSLTSSRCCCC